MRTGTMVWLIAALMCAAGALWFPAAASAQEPGGTAIRGELADDDGKPVEGVVIAASRGGEPVGDATSDENGQWSIELPGAGEYQVSLDVATLPDGVALRDPDRATLERVRLREGQNRPVLFQLGEARTRSTSRVDRLVNLAVDGLRLGLILALCAVGLSLIYGVTGLTNFAHGDLVTFGAMVAFWLSAASGGPGLPLVLAGIAAVVAGGALGFAMERGLFAPLRRRRSGTVSLMVVTIGLSLVIRHLYLIWFGGRPRPFDEFTLQSKFDVGPISLRPKDYVVILIAAATLVAFGVMLKRTRLGISMRAVSDNRDLAESSGIDVRRVMLATWVLGAGLAALGGVLQGVSETVIWDMGFVLLLLIFAAVVLGGLGTAYGAMVGGLVLGLASQLSTYWIEAKFRTAIGLTVLIVVILFRPQGIFGRAERVG